MLFSFSVSYLVLLAGAIASMIIGSLWYSQMLFGKMWMRLSNMTKGKVKNSMTTSYLLAFIGSIVMTFVLANVFSVFSLVGVNSLAEGFELVFYLWLGIVVPITMGSVLWDSKPWAIFWITSIYYLVLLLVLSAIIVLL